MENQEQEQTPLERGDVVRLKSGGITMTVDEVVYQHIKVRYWDDIAQQFKNQTFDIDTLDIIKKAK